MFTCKLRSATYPDDSPEVVKEMTLTLLSLGESLENGVIFPINFDVLIEVQASWFFILTSYAVYFFCKNKHVKSFSKQILRF